MKIKFSKSSKEFHSSVTKAVDEYFAFHNRSKKANWFMYSKTIFFVTILVISYLTLLFGNYGLWANYVLWVIIGLSSVFLAVNCGHDAIHGAYSDRKWINMLMSNSYNLLGANSYLWSIQHNIVHHTYTNIQGADEDIEAVPFARLSPAQEWRPYQKYQHIWVLFLYAFSTLSWVFKKDYKKFFQKKIGNYENKQHPKIQFFNLLFFKGLYYSFFIALPIVIIDLPWYQTLGGFLLSHLLEGFTVAIIFALAHIVEKTHFPIPDTAGNVNNNWAVHQMHTTADFGRSSTITGFFTGGLNFQIEHHLFPSICHVHYSDISKIVKEKAEEYGVPYNEYPSFYDALKSHIRLLKQLGNNSFSDRSFTKMEELEV